uniref:Uncharacterized protein n=1 Tax=Pararge aegeria TaxID=116150 RepID=S4PTD9_9NEOP
MNGSVFSTVTYGTLSGAWGKRVVATFSTFVTRTVNYYLLPSLNSRAILLESLYLTYDHSVKILTVIHARLGRLVAFKFQLTVHNIYLSIVLFGFIHIFI